MLRLVGNRTSLRGRPGVGACPSLRARGGGINPGVGGGVNFRSGVCHTVYTTSSGRRAENETGRRRKIPQLAREGAASKSERERPAARPDPPEAAARGGGRGSGRRPSWPRGLSTLGGEWWAESGGRRLVCVGADVLRKSPVLCKLEEGDAQVASSFVVQMSRPLRARLYPQRVLIHRFGAIFLEHFSLGD